MKKHYGILLIGPTFMKNFKPTALNCRLFKSQVIEELFYIVSSLSADEEDEAVQEGEAVLRPQRWIKFVDIELETRSFPDGPKQMNTGAGGRLSVRVKVGGRETQE